MILGLSMITIAVLLAFSSYTGYSNVIGNFVVGHIYPDAIITNSNSAITLAQDERHSFIIQAIDDQNRPLASHFYWHLDGALVFETTMGFSSVYEVSNLAVGSHTVEVYVFDLATRSDAGHYSASVTVVSSNPMITAGPTQIPTPVASLMVDNTSPSYGQTVYFTVFTQNIAANAYAILHAYINGQEVTLPSSSYSQVNSAGIAALSAVPSQITNGQAAAITWKVSVSGVNSNSVVTTYVPQATVAPTFNPTLAPTPLPTTNDDTTVITLGGGIDFNLLVYVGALIMGIVGSVLAVKARKK
jgi:hypothetical protein